jgi:nucleotide-binding universal stress UspA family protein
VLSPEAVSRVVDGEASQVIVHLAGAEHCDSIVMATHGRSGFRGSYWVLSQVTSYETRPVP